MVGGHRVALGPSWWRRRQQKEDHRRSKARPGPSSLRDSEQQQVPHCQPNTWALSGLESWTLPVQAGSGLGPPCPIARLLGFAGGEGKGWGLAAASFL